MAGSLSPLLLLTSSLGDDTSPIQTGTLHAVGMTATEQLSQPFAMRLTVVSTERVISPNELVYQPVCLTIHRQPYADRFFNGIVRQMEAVGEAQRDRWKYHLDVVPRLWFLTQTSDCRIFQQKTVVEILQTIFGEHQVAPVEFRIFGLTTPLIFLLGRCCTDSLGFPTRLGDFVDECVSWGWKRRNCAMADG